MPTVIVSRNPDGTAAVTTPIPRQGETYAEAVARVLEAIPGGEPLSAELVSALRAGDAPPDAARVVPVAEVYRRLAPAYLTLAGMSPELQAKWDRIIGGGGLLERFERIDLSSDTLAALLGAAVYDGLLSEEQAAAVSEPIQA